MIPLPRLLDGAVDAVERATWLDAVAEQVATLARRALPDGPVRDAASGTAVGHPVHPALVAVPMGSWLAASYLDLAGGRQSRPAAERLVALGIATAVPAAVTGASDWLDTSGGERRVGLVHAALNYAALAMYAGSWLQRRRKHQVRGAALALGGGAVLGASGWLGGHLAYAMGVGVDTTAFQQYPLEWTDVAADSELAEGVATTVEVDGVPLLLIRRGGTVRALADRCTHRGGPLHEGEITGDCVICPWHDSRFSLVDGRVEQGPATRPQPVLEVQVVDGRVQVRRPDEPRSLRNNPAGV